MDLGLTRSQELLRGSARDFLERECPPSAVRQAEDSPEGYIPALYRKIAELGWLGLGIPREYGGSGGDITDLAVLYEELGRAVVPGPHFATSVVCARAIQELGTEAQRQTYLPAICRGELIVVPALYEESAGYDAASVALRATPQAGGYVLEGTKLFVPYAHVAPRLMVLARTSPETEDGTSLFLVPVSSPGISQELLTTLAGDKQSEVVFDRVAVPEDSLVGPRDQAWTALKPIRQWASVVQCAEMVGGAQKALEMAVEYSKARVAFGRPIGAFQAIQHKAADMLSDVDGARYITYEAACKLKEGAADLKEIPMARAFVAEAYRRVTKEAHQIFGGVGFMLDHPMNLYYRRAKALELSLGDVDWELDRVAEGLGL